ncbi:MAG: PKD domain-containing protein [Bacteroidia bacterium]
MKNSVSIRCLFVLLLCFQVASTFAQCDNVALGKPVTASAELGSNPAQNAVDGDCSAIWNAGNFATQYIQVDLGALYTINNINIMFEMTPNGNVNHEILTSPDMVTWNVVDVATGFYITGQLIERCYSSSPLTNVRGVRINSITSPSWIAIREFGVYTLSTPQIPTISASGPLTICQGESVVLTASTAYSYLWSTGETTQSITVNTAGNYSVTTTQGPSCTEGTLPCTTCGQGTNSVTVAVNPLPVIAVTPQAPSICGGFSQQIEASGANSYSWSPATGLNTTTNDTVVATPTSTITYTVAGTDAQGCVGTNTVTVNVANAQLNVNVNSGLNPLCDSTKLNWATWSSVNSTTGVGIISSNLSVTVSKPSGGLSTTGVMYNGGIFPSQYTVPGSSTAIRNDLAGLFTFCFSSPVVNPQIALSSIGNPNNSVQVNTSQPYQVIWQGSGMSYPNSNAFIGTEGYTIVKFPGIHTCISFDYLQSETYCNLAFGVLDTNCQALTPPVLCAGTPDTLYASGATTYSWSPAQGLDVTSGPVVIATPSVTTTYYVTGSDSNGCSDTDSITITVNPSPPIAITADTSICIGDSTLLVASGADSYLWKPSNTVNAQISVSPLTNDMYEVVGTNSFGCSDSATINVIVNALPSLQLTANEVCLNDSTAFTLLSTGNIVSWNWKYGDGAFSSQQNTLHKYTICDSFNVVLTATTIDGCIDSTAVIAKVNCLPIADFQFSNNCVNDSILFTDASTVVNSSIAQWNWTFGDNTSSATLQNVSHAYTQAGQYNVAFVSTTNKGCIDTLSQTVTVYPRPLVLFNLDNICAGNIATFTNFSEIQTPGVISSWQWNFADNSPGLTTMNATHSYPQSGVYNVQLTAVSDFGCADSALKTLVVNPNPSVAFSAIDTAGCFPLCVSFQDQSTILSPANIVNWLWHFGDGDSVLTSNAQHCFVNTSATDIQAYTVSLTATSDSGCVTTLTKNNYIQVYPKPQATFIADPLQTPVTNPVVSFVNQSVGADFAVWNFGETTDSLYTLIVPSYQYADTGTFLINLVVYNQYQCFDTAVQNVVIEPSFTFYVPNAFSPNNDGVNDSFIGVGNFVTEFAMSIFDRWGVLVYYTDDIKKPWDGTINNGKVLAKQDTYVYSIEIKDFKKRKYNYKGIVTLVGGNAD